MVAVAPPATRREHHMFGSSRCLHPTQSSLNTVQYMCSIGATGIDGAQ